MTNPIDTIREALSNAPFDPTHALAALTKVEHQLAAEETNVTRWQSRAHNWHERAVAAETALAEANREINRLTDNIAKDMAAIKAAERRANELADLWRKAIEQDARWGGVYPATIQSARAALDRQEQR